MSNQRILSWAIVVAGIVATYVFAPYLDRWLLSQWLLPSFGFASIVFLLLAIVRRKNPLFVRTGLFGAVGSMVVAASVYSKAWPGNVWLTLLGFAIVLVGWFIGMGRLYGSGQEEWKGPRR